MLDFVGTIAVAATLAVCLFASIGAMAVRQAAKLALAAAVSLGFLSHLVLDEIWSIDLARLRLKSSFGTAVKLWGDCWWANLATYANVIVLALLITADFPPMREEGVPNKPEMVATQPDEATLWPF